MRANIVAFGGAVVLTLVATVGGVAQEKTVKEQEKAIKDNERNVVVNIVGCVEREADYRKQIGQGKGGPLNSGVGEGDEYILRYARSVPKGAVSKETSIGTAGSENIYSVTGKLEDLLKAEVGHQVEVTGYVEVAKTDGSEKVHQLPRLHIDKWSRVATSCPNTK
jgi:hypothetical protein